MFQPKPGMPNVWRGITDNAKFLCEAIQVAIGDGSTTLFWDHKWTSLKLFIDVVTFEVPSSLTGAIVEEMWEPNQDRR